MSRFARMISLSCLASFAAGAGAGWWARDVSPCQRDPSRKYVRTAQLLDSRLDLTSSQKTQVHSILQDRQKKMESLKEETRPRFEEIRRSSQEEIRRLLNPNQQKALDRLEMEWQVRRLKRPQGAF